MIYCMFNDNRSISCL